MMDPTHPGDDMDTRKDDWITLADQRVSGITGLQTKKSSKRLNQIDRIRATGVGDHISLPQLVVCGDQSSGKSSVLEAITNIPFPRDEGLCTRFATEIILRHEPGKNEISAKILPDASRGENERHRISSFERKLDGFENLPGVIEEALGIMGISSNLNVVDYSKSAFSADTLRLEVVGDTNLHLTVVDLPGLISVSENMSDVKIVSDLVDKYLKSSRTIILAVVPAGSDIDTQGIIQKARQFDPTGERTVGIITKPDLINKGAEPRIANLAKNKERIKLKLGFFLLKNPTLLDIRKGVSFVERQKQEREFFRTSPWKEQNLDMKRVGIENLRSFLQGLLDSHIERELPKVQQEAKILLKATERQLDSIGSARSSADQIRIYLTRISMNISNLIRAAVEGNYAGGDSLFFKKLTTNARLRAKVHRENERFASEMRSKAAKRTVVSENELKEDSKNEEGDDDDDDSDSDDDDSENGSDSDQSDEDDVSDKSDKDEVSYDEIDGDQLRLSQNQMLKWIKQTYQNTRGRELPGNYSHTLLLELFHEQSSRWESIAELHLQSVYNLVKGFIHSVLQHVIIDDHVRIGVGRRIGDSLENSLQSAQEELNRLILDEKAQPITYNHYYTDNIQNDRTDAARRQLQDSIDVSVAQEFNGKSQKSNKEFNIQQLATSLKSRVIVDMTEQACLESLAALNAYYKVSMKTFVDNVCRQVIERHLLRDLNRIFDPVSVGLLTEKELIEVAQETVQVRDLRNHLDNLKRTLRETLVELRA